VSMTGPAGTQMDHWDRPLPLAIMPKSGPLPLMVSLLDANRALIDKLPKGYLKRSHWLRAGQTLVPAAQTGEHQDIELAFEAIVDALVREGWLKRRISIPEPPRAERPRFELRRLEEPCSEPLRSERQPRPVGPSKVHASVGNVAPRRPAEPLWRRIRAVATDRLAAEAQQRASVSSKPAPKDLKQFVREYLLVLPGNDR
jgi:hypothetical protein